MLVWNIYRGKPEGGSYAGNVYTTDGLAPALTTATGGGRQPMIIVNSNDMAKKIRIRKLTERECFRLMGVGDTEIDKLLNAGISRTQLYKMAGNSIVVDVLAAIFDRLLVHTEVKSGTQTNLFDMLCFTNNKKNNHGKIRLDKNFEGLPGGDDVLFADLWRCDV